MIPSISPKNKKKKKILSNRIYSLELELFLLSYMHRVYRDIWSLVFFFCWNYEKFHLLYIVEQHQTFSLVKLEAVAHHLQVIAQFVCLEILLHAVLNSTLAWFITAKYKCRKEPEKRSPWWECKLSQAGHGRCIAQLLCRCSLLQHHQDSRLPAPLQLPFLPWSLIPHGHLHFHPPAISSCYSKS